MPIYGYKCSCGKTEELFVRHRVGHVPPECDDCHETMVRTVGNTSFRLKGTGWYVTDYKKKE